MSGDAIALQAQRPVYGAKELKLIIKRNTMRSFIIALLSILLLILIYFVVNYFQQASIGLKKQIVVTKINLSDLPPPPQADAPPPPPPSAQVASPTVAGTPIPVPETMLTPDTKEFANVDELKTAPAIPTEGTGSTEVVIDQGAQVTKEVEPAPDDFIPVEKDAVTDMNDLQKRVVYPPQAIKQNIEGKVLVRVLIGKDGRPKRCIIDQSVNSSLDEAAKKAVMSSIFTPAIQNGAPVEEWVSVPVNFTLR